nr:uncharacterized protein LOC113706312 [Coffea arabica]
MQSEYETDCSRELKSESESEDEDGRKRNKKPKFSVFNEKTEMRSPRFKVGQRFSSVVIFRLAVRIQAIMEGRDVQFIKNDTYRVRVKCRGCEWQIFGSKMQGENTFQIKTLSKEHTCGRVFHNRNMTSKLATRLFVDEVRKTPSMTVQELMTRVTEELNVDFSLKQGYRTMKKVRDIIEGSHEKQYALLEDFCGELRRANPGSTVFVETDEDEDGIVRFKRLYMCLEPLKRGFLKGCRHWIGLDGCFLKDTYGGQLLTAVGMDGDNKMFPLALSVVRVENYDNWSWFLGLLVQDLEISDSSNWCVMTDKQKGLVQAVRDKMPQAEHRCCVQHLYTNFKQIHRGLALKERLWKCAKASYVTHWKVEMEQLGQESAAAHSWLDEKDPKTWCRAHFRCGLDCDILVNNMCESFNAVILKARSLPIISMLQTIYLYLLKRMERNREAMSKHEGLLCPAIFEILEKAKQEQCMCIASYAGTMKYQISCPFGEQYIVDMAAKTCSCRKWQLRGIPCGHAVAAINRRHEAPEKHVSNTYLKITYLQSYEPVLNPINGPNLWEHIDLPAMKSPTYRRFARRPKKMRKKASEEDRRDSCVNQTKPHKVSKVGTMMSCSRCKKYGHNKRGCPDKNKQTTEGTTTSSAKENSDIGDTGPSMQPSTNEACPSDVTVDILGVSTQQSHTGPSQNLDANQPKQGAQEPVTKKGRKCSFCRKHGHS